MSKRSTPQVPCSAQTSPLDVLTVLLRARFARCETFFQSPSKSAPPERKINLAFFYLKPVMAAASLNAITGSSPIQNPKRGANASHRKYLAPRKPNQLSFLLFIGRCGGSVLPHRLFITYEPKGGRAYEKALVFLKYQGFSHGIN